MYLAILLFKCDIKGSVREVCQVLGAVKCLLLFNYAGQFYGRQPCGARAEQVVFLAIPDTAT